MTNRKERGWTLRNRAGLVRTEVTSCRPSALMFGREAKRGYAREISNHLVIIDRLRCPMVTIKRRKQKTGGKQASTLRVHSPRLREAVELTVIWVGKEF